jgi:hypothetical protein
MNPEDAMPISARFVEPHHHRPVRIGPVVIGWVRLTKGGHWQAYSYTRGHGWSPLSSEADAAKWVADENAKGGILNYSRAIAPASDEGGAK